MVGKTYDFILWLLPKVDNFARQYRFTLGDRIITQGLDLLSTLVEAAYATNKEGALDVANRRVNSTRPGSWTRSGAWWAALSDPS